MKPTVVVTGIAGQQQRAVADVFAEADWNVRGISRTASSQGNVVAADLETGQGLEQAFDKAQVVAFTLPQDHRDGVMEKMAHNVAAAAKYAGVRKIVFNTAGSIDEKSELPMFAEMRAARDAIRSGDVTSVTLQPTVYMDNLLAPHILSALTNDGMLAYPARRDAPISWMSHDTLARYFHAAATNNKADGQIYQIGGPDAQTGDEIARILAAHLDRSIGYAQIPLKAFAQGLNALFGEPAGDRIASLYAQLEANPEAMKVSGEASQALGVTGEDFAEFVARNNWLSANG